MSGRPAPAAPDVTGALAWMFRATARAPSLTVAQRGVLGCLAAGMDIRNTAVVLEISERTVKAHTTEIFHRLGLDSRLKAGIFAYQLAMDGRLDLPVGASPKVHLYPTADDP